MSGRQLFWVLLPLAGLCLLSQARHAGQVLRASRQLSAVEAITLRASQSGRLDGRLVEQNLQVLQQAAELAPTEVAIPIARGALYLLSQRPQAAIRAYREALSLEPRAEVYANLGRAQMAAGEHAAARESFRLARRLDHNLTASLPPEPATLQSEAAPTASAAVPSPRGFFADGFETQDLRHWSERVGGP